MRRVLLALSLSLLIPALGPTPAPAQAPQPAQKQPGSTQAPAGVSTLRIDSDAFRQIADRALAGLVVEAKSCGPKDSSRLTTIRVPNVYKDIQPLPRFEYELTEKERENAEFSDYGSGASDWMRRRVRGCVNPLTASQKASVRENGWLGVDLKIHATPKKLRSHTYEDVFVVGRAIHGRKSYHPVNLYGDAWDWKDDRADDHLPDYTLSRLDATGTRQLGASAISIALEPTVLDGELTYRSVTASWDDQGEWAVRGHRRILRPHSNNFTDENVYKYDPEYRTSVKPKMTEYVKSMQDTVTARVRAAFDSREIREHLSQALTAHARGATSLDVKSVSMQPGAVVAQLGARPAPTFQNVSPPSCVSWGPRHIDCFARGADNRLKHAVFEGSSWSRWRDLGGDLRSAPAVTSWVAGRLDVFARAADGQLLHIWAQGANRGGRWDLHWGEWEKLGGQLRSAPGCVSWSRDRIDCFARGKDNRLKHLWYARKWGEWEDLGGNLRSAPSVASWDHGRLDVFARGGNRQLIHFWYSGEWSNRWEDLGGQLASAPGCVSPGKRKIECFARGTKDQLLRRSYVGSWQPWVDLGGRYESAPSVSSWGDGRLDVFAGGADRQMWHAWFDGRWHPARPRGGTLYATARP